MAQHQRPRSLLLLLPSQRQLVILSAECQACQASQPHHSQPLLQTVSPLTLPQAALSAWADAPVSWVAAAAAA